MVMMQQLWQQQQHDNYDSDNMTAMTTTAAM